MLVWRVGRGGAPAPLDWLHVSEERRLASFSHAPRRQQFLNARWALRELLAETFDLQAQVLRIGIDEGGRSAWAERPALRLSLSHSGSYWAVAVADQALGIDLEVPRPGRERRELAALLLGEAAPVDARARQQALLREWCLREAWLKCHDLPLSALPDLRFREAAGASVAAVQQPADETWTLALVSAALPPLPAGWRYFQRA